MTIEVGKAGGGLPQLAPDLNFISNNVASTVVYQNLLINPAGALTTALSLTGKFAIAALAFSSVLAENVTIVLTIDDVVIINDNFTSGISVSLLNATNGTPSGDSNDVGAILCNSSLLLQIQTATDTSVVLNYIARPIL